METTAEVPAATVLVRREFADRLPDMLLYRYLPAARAAVAATRPTVAGVVADATGLAALAKDAASDGDRLIAPPAADVLVLRRGRAL
jgi:hypothetical protein